MSTVEVLVTATTIDVQVILSQADTATLDHEAGDSAPTGAKAATRMAALKEIGRKLLYLRSGVDALIPTEISVALDADDEVRFVLRFPAPAADVLVLRAVAVAELAHGHRQFVSVRDRYGTLAERLLDRGADTIEVALRRAVDGQGAH